MKNVYIWYISPFYLFYWYDGRRSLVGCSPWGREESDTTEPLHFHFSLSRIGEGNGNPLQCSCLENPRDGEAWWLPSMGSHRVGHDWSDLAAAAAWWLMWTTIPWYLIYTASRGQYLHLLPIFSYCIWWDMFFEAMVWWLSETYSHPLSLSLTRRKDC